MFDFFLKFKNCSVRCLVGKPTTFYKKKSFENESCLIRCLIKCLASQPTKKIF